MSIIGSQEQMFDTTEFPPWPVITNVDFIVLFLNKYGVSLGSDVRKNLLSWREKEKKSKSYYITYLTGDYCGSTYDAHAFWYRKSPGVYALTIRGKARVSEIMQKVSSYEEKRLKKNRVPQKYHAIIRDIASKEEQPIPRFAFAKKLQKSEPQLSFKTCMEYIFYAAEEGILTKVGTNYK